MIPNLVDGHFCYSACVGDKSCLVGVVVEDVSGYYATNWTFATYKEAEETAQIMNDKLGLDKEQVCKIICSSMRRH